MLTSLACMALSVSAQQLPPPQSRGAITDSSASAPQRIQGRIFTDEEVGPLGRQHDWYLCLEQADGSPMEGAQIEAEGIHPETGQGLPSPPRVLTYVGYGHYLVEEVFFPAGGHWALHFRVRWQGKTELLRFTVFVPPQHP